MISIRILVIEKKEICMINSKNAMQRRNVILGLSPTLDNAMAIHLFGEKGAEDVIEKFWCREGANFTTKKDFGLAVLR